MQGAWVQFLVGEIRFHKPHSMKKKKKGEEEKMSNEREHATKKCWELYFIYWTFLGLQAWETVSQVTLRKLLPGGEKRSQVI